MTAMYGYTSKTRGLAFLGSDNLRGHDGTRADKIDLVGARRFAVGVLGPDAPAYALAIVKSFEQCYGSKRLESVWDVVTELVKVLKPFAEGLFKRYQQRVQCRAMPQNDFDELTQMRSQIAVLDTREVELHSLDLGHCFPPSGLNLNPGIQTFPQERLCLFGCARDGVADTAILEQSALDDPVSMLDSRLEADRTRNPIFVGRRGAYVTVRDGLTLFSSCFASPEDWVDNHFQTLSSGDHKEES